MNLKLLTWNVNGIRASIKKDFWEKISELNPDFVCLQELKCQNEDMVAIFAKKDNSEKEKTDNLFITPSNLESEFSGEISKELNVNDFVAFYHTCRMKKGYSGTAIFVKKSLLDSNQVQVLEEFKYLGDDKFDFEGRLIGLKLKIGSELLFLLNGYYPQGGRDGRVAYKIEFYELVAKQVRKWQNDGYKVILCGDLNTTIGDIDLARPKENKKTTGCLPEERLVLNWLIDSALFDQSKLLITNSDFEYLNLLDIQKLELVDCFRYYFPDEIAAYTYWDQITRARDRNVGWRIDYWLIDQLLLKSLKSCRIESQVLGSDHCPVIVELEF